MTVGSEFTIGRHRLEEGWEIFHPEAGPGFGIFGTVTNVSDRASAAIFEIKFLKGTLVVARYQCTSGQLEPGQSETASCSNMMEAVYAPSAAAAAAAYDSVTAEATF